MNEYKSKTGYVKNVKTNECFEAFVIYLGINSKESDFEDISKETYEAWEEEQRRKYEPVE